VLRAVDLEEAENLVNALVRERYKGGGAAPPQLLADAGIEPLHQFVWDHARREAPRILQQSIEFSTLAIEEGRDPLGLVDTITLIIAWAWIDAMLILNEALPGHPLSAKKEAP
jgi:hypothetical protein